jgi:hypothetical protein
MNKQTTLHLNEIILAPKDLFATGCWGDGIVSVSADKISVRFPDSNWGRSKLFGHDLRIAVSLSEL